MKKLIISTVVLAALSFAACKKDNLQPTTNSTNVEQLNNQVSEDDKAVDARNKFVGIWKGTSFGATSKYGYSQSGIKFTYVISKYGAKKLKIKVTLNYSATETESHTVYAYVTTSNKLIFLGSWYGTANDCDVPFVKLDGEKSVIAANKITIAYEMGECDYFKAVATVTKQ